MPFAILLQKLVKAFDNGSKSIAGWSALALLEERVFERARGIFLVRWFGRGLPLHDRALRISIANLDALRARFAAVRAQRSAPEGLSLTEPLAGSAGALVGSLASPAGSIVATFAIGRALSGRVSALGLVLIGVVSLLLGPAVGAVLGAAGLLAAAGLAIGAPLVATRGRGRALLAFSGGLAEALDAFNALFEQLLGPRAGVRNPLLRKLLEIGDRLATALFHAVGFVAVMAAHGGSVLRPLIAQLPPLFALARAVVDLVAFLISDLATRLGAMIYGPYGPMSVARIVLDRVQMVAAITHGLVQILPGDFLRRVHDWWPAVQAGLAAWWDATFALLQQRLGGHSGWQALLVVKERFEVALDFLRAPGPSASSTSSASSKSLGAAFSAALQPSLARLARATGGDPIGYALGTLSAGPLPDAAAVARGAGGVPAALTMDAIQRQMERGALTGERLDPFALGDAARRGLAAARRPRSVFAAERRRLEAELGRPPAEELLALRARELPLREALASIVAGAFPAAAATSIVELDELFQSIDRTVHGTERAAAERQQLPIREILESRRLQPVVRTLRVRARGHARGAADAWTERLRRALGEQRYVASE